MSNNKRIISIVLCVLLIIPLLIHPVTGLDPQNDANSGSDAPDNSMDALSVSFDTLYAGEVGDTLLNADDEDDNNDYYYITTSEPGGLSVSYQVASILNSSLSSVIIYDGLQLLGAESFWEDDPKMYLVVPLVNTGNFVINIYSYSDFVEYEFKITFKAQSYSQDDAGSGSDADVIGAPELSLDTEYTGEIGYGSATDTGAADIFDYYTINLPSSGYLNIISTLTTDDDFDNLIIAVETDELKTVYSDSLGLFDISLDFDAPIPKAGSFYVSLYSSSWNSSYTIELSFTAATLPSQNDANLGGDASELYNDAPTIALNSTITGTVGEGLIEVSDDARDDRDAYKFATTEYGRLEVTLTITDSEESYPSLFIDVYNNSDLFEFSMMGFYIGLFDPSDNDSVILMAGDAYYIEIDALDRNVSYELTLDFFELPYTPPSDTTTTEDTTSTTTNPISSSTPEGTTENTDTGVIGASDTEASNYYGITIMLVGLFGTSIIFSRRKR